MAKVIKRTNKLYAQRYKSRLTVQEVAKVLGVDHSTITRWENGDRPIPTHQVVALAKLFKIETHELFDTGNQVE